MGFYLYEPGLVDVDFLRDLYSDKLRWRILSLSATPSDMLMWSYYAESHSGFVVGVQITDPFAHVKPVKYVRRLDLEADAEEVTLRVLCKKLSAWKHEEEQRGAEGIHTRSYLHTQSFLHQSKSMRVDLWHSNRQSQQKAPAYHCTEILARN